MADTKPRLDWYATTMPGTARIVHAARREASDFGMEFPSAEAREAWYTVADANDPEYMGCYTIRVLCRRGGGCERIPRVWRDPFSPVGEYRRVGGLVVTCPDCAALFTALYADPVPGWDRDCPECARSLPINYFATDKRTSDGLAKLCTPCRYRIRWDNAFERKYGRRPSRG